MLRNPLVSLSATSVTADTNILSAALTVDRPVYAVIALGTDTAGALSIKEGSISYAFAAASAGTANAYSWVFVPGVSYQFAFDEDAIVRLVVAEA